jgi:hypothetical protein
MNPKRHSESWVNYGNNVVPVSASSFVLPQSVRLCPDFENAADLEWPASDPANAGVRGEFLLGIFPPDHGGNHAPTPTTPTPQTPAK